MKRFVFLLGCLPLLAACVTPDEANKRMTRGCSAAVEVFLDDGFSIKKVKKATHKPSKEFGNGYKEVMLFAVESDGWLDVDKEYKCIFAEEWGMFNSTHKASIYQVNVNGETFGQKGDEVLGTMDQHLKLHETVERAMMR